MVSSDSALPRIAVIGAGIFVRTQYIPRLREIADLMILKAIWSRTEESAKAAAQLARDFAPSVEVKWGDSGLQDIIEDSSIDGVAVVLAGQVQVDISLTMLRAKKHVLQEKPAAGSIAEAETALSCYQSVPNFVLSKPIWAVAENYRFEPAFVESRKLIDGIGDMMNIQVIVEGSMNSSNPYFSSSWRRNFSGGFILDMGVHFIAGLRMFYRKFDQFRKFHKRSRRTVEKDRSDELLILIQLVGCEITTVSALSRHVDMTLPPPDNICSLLIKSDGGLLAILASKVLVWQQKIKNQLENGCAGVFVMAVSSKSPKIYWRVDGTKGAVQVERSTDNGRHGYSVLFYSEDGECQKTFYPFSGVNEELKAFIHDISHANKKDGAAHEAEPRSSYVEGARDVAVLEAMLESSAKQGSYIQVKKF